MVTESWAVLSLTSPSWRADGGGQGSDKGAWLGPGTTSRASQARAPIPSQEQGRGNRMVEGSRSSTERFQMAVGTEAAEAFQSPGQGVGGKLAGPSLSPDISPIPTPTPPQPHSISRLPRKLQEAWGRRRTDARVGVCRASASEGCLMRAEDPADPETSVWKLENVTQKEAWRRRFLWAAAQLCCCPCTAGQEPAGSWAGPRRSSHLLFRRAREETVPYTPTVALQCPGRRLGRGVTLFPPPACRESPGPKSMARCHVLNPLLS